MNSGRHIVSMQASRLRLARVALSLSQDELATRSGCSRALISMIENGYVVPRPATAARIAEALGLSDTTLFEDSAEKGPE